MCFVVAFIGNPSQRCLQVSYSASINPAVVEGNLIVARKPDRGSRSQMFAVLPATGDELYADDESERPLDAIGGHLVHVSVISGCQLIAPVDWQLRAVSASSEPSAISFRFWLLIGLMPSKSS